MATSTMERPAEQVNKVDQRYRDEFLTRKAEALSDVVYAQNGMYDSIQRVTDSEMQKQGIDMIYENHGSIYYVDEKAAVNYRFRDLQTFSFELASSNNKDENGWFVNKDIQTTHYMLQWYRAPTPAEFDERNIPSWDKEGRQEIREALKEYANHEDFDKLSRYEMALISKQAIVDMLKQDGIVPEEILSEFKKSFSNPQNLPDNGCFIDWDDKGHPKSYRMPLCDGKYTVVQSLNLKEKPINIVISKDVLLSKAEKVMRDYSIDVNKAISDFERQKNQPQPDLSTIVKPKTLEALEQKGLITGMLYLDDGKQQKQGRIKPQDGMKLTLGKDRNDPNNTIGVYRASDKKWVLYNDSIPVKNKAMYVSYRADMIASLNRGEAPRDFRTLDKYHNPVDRTHLSHPEHGDMLTYCGEKTFGQKVELTYNQFAKAWLMKDNHYLSVNELSRFNGLPVIQQHEWDIRKAVAQRLVSECLALRNERLSPMAYTNGPEKTQIPLYQYIAETIQKIQQDDFKQRRCSEEELVFQKASTIEKNKLFEELSNPFYAKELAKELMSLSRDERLKSGLLASVLYDSNLIDRTHEAQRIAEEKARAEQERLRLEKEKREQEARQKAEIAQKAAARREAFANPVHVNKVAMDNGAPTFVQMKKPPYSEIPTRTEFVSWTKDTIKATAQLLKDQIQPGQPCCISASIEPCGQVPPYAMAAISNLLPDRQVYIETKRNDPVEIIPKPLSMPDANGVLESKGVKFQVIESASAVEIQWQLTDETKRYYHPADLRELQLPMVSPDKEIYIKNVGTHNLPYGSDFVTAIMGKTYSQNQDDVYLYNNYTRGYNCIASDVLERIGVGRTENDLQCLRSENVSRGTLQERGDTVIILQATKNRTEPEFEKQPVLEFAGICSR